MYVELKNGSYLTIAGALLQTKDTVINYDQNNYRDQPPVLPAVGAGSAGAALSTNTTSSAQAPAASGSGLTVTPTVLVDSTAAVEASVSIVATSSVAQDDNLLHMAPRPQMFLRDRFRWWDKANPGTAKTIAGDTATGSALVTVASIEGLFVGQVVTHADFAAGTFIQELKYVLVAPTANIQPTLTPTIVMSNVSANTTADAQLAFAAGADGAPNLLGECWCDRYVGWSSGIPTRF